MCNLCRQLSTNGAQPGARRQACKPSGRIPLVGTNPSLVKEKRVIDVTGPDGLE